MLAISDANPGLVTGESEPDSITGITGSVGNFSGTGSGELPGMHVSYKLDDKNYLQWVQLVQTFLKGRGKLGHLTASPPTTTDPAFPAWDIENSLIMSWLWNAMQPEVCKNYMFLDSAKAIGDTIRQTYSKVQDVSVIFDNKTKINSTR